MSSQHSQHIEELKRFKPLNELSDQQLILVSARSSKKMFAPEESILHVGDNDMLEYFLLEGSIELESFDGRFSQISAKSDRATTAIALLQPRKYNVKAKTECTFIIVDQNTVNTLLKERPRAREVSFSVSDLHTGRELENIEKTFKQDLASNNIELPSFPDVAVNIRRVMNDPDVSADRVADVLKNDPAITLKLLKVCNGPLYRSTKEIASNQEAIVRLGFDTTRQLVTVFALRELFKSENSFLQNKMRELWLQSREVAAFSYVLAKHTKGMNPELALLAGLLKDIGVIPVLIYLERYPQFMKLDHKVDQITRSLKRKLGATLIKHWGLQKELVETALNSENWAYDSGSNIPTYSDITIVAQLHSFIGRKKENLPPFDQVPAFKKLGDGGLSPQESQEILQESKQQLQELETILSPSIPTLS